MENRRKKKTSTITCVNCGGPGHVYRTCNHPIISYGFIVFRKNVLHNTDEFLMVQRKDSLSYVEFIRGKYDVNNITYLLSLISNMTVIERDRISTQSFLDLWKDMWCKYDDSDKNYNREFHEAKNKFNCLKKGFFIQYLHGEIVFFDIQYCLNKSICKYEDTEWGFPKGRRNVNESDLNCALREFREETGLDPKCLVSFDLKPFEETFSGSNKKRYKHIYYIAEVKKEIFVGKPSNREIKDIKWFSYEEAQNHIRPINVERKELLRRVQSVISKKILD